jgi:amino acid transporter
MLPDAGGDFAYLNRAYGDLASFSFAWCNFWINKTGSQAIISTVFGRYLISGLFGQTFASSSEGAFASKAASIALVIALCALNCSGVRESASFLNVLTATKLFLVFSLFIAAGLYVIFGDADTIRMNLAYPESFEGSHGYGGFFTAMVACLWAFDGWGDLNFMAEELKQPEVNLSKVVFTSVLLVAVAYVLANIAYLSTLDLEDIKTSQSIAQDFGIAVHGAFLACVLSLGVAVSTTGSCNGSIMTGGRALYAVARAGRAPGILNRLNENGSPDAALIAQMSWTLVLLCLPGSGFSSLLDYFGPASWFYYALTGFGVIVLRRKEPNTHRPFLVPLYPIPPIILVTVSVCLVFTSIVASPFFTSLAFGFIALSIPVWYLLVRESGSKSGSVQHKVQSVLLAMQDIGAIQYEELRTQEVNSAHGDGKYGGNSLGGFLRDGKNSLSI